MKGQITALIKPVSGACGLDCKYCFYRELDPGGGVMDEKTVDALLSFLPRGVRVNIAFQGGEPLLRGADFYRDLARRVKAAGIDAAYSIQTNGVMIDREYCRLFRDHDFLVGLSLDGTRACHDAARVDKNGKGTYDRVIAAAELLQSCGVPFDVLTVVGSHNCHGAAEIYADYKKRGFRIVQLIPCLPPLHGMEGESCDVSDFFIEFFDLWYRDVRSGKAVFDVREFSELSDALRGGRPGCRYGGVCTPQFVVESNGDLYPCDFYVKPEYRTGSVFDTPIDETLKSEGMRRFIRDSRENAEICRLCPYLSVCRGMCRRMRTLFRQFPVCPWARLISHVTKQRGCRKL